MFIKRIKFWRLFIMIELLGVKDVAKILKSSLPTARAFLHRPDCPTIKVGRRLCISKEALEEYLKHRHVD